jgi:ABC-2 type transport system ATP-binding protein
MNRQAGPVPAIEALAVSKHYGEFAAVTSVSFEIHHGQIVGLLGPNGAGKTTIMRMLTGYLAPSNGCISVAGANVETDRRAAAAAIGYLPENGPLYLDMTPRDMLQFFGEARGLTRARVVEGLARVAAQCDIQQILDKPIGRLSKGLRQRVGLAQALLHDPAVLIMDEPTAGLDPLQVRQFRRLVQELGTRSTILISTHILQEVEALADRILIIDRGRLLFDGTVTQLHGEGSLEQKFCQLIDDGAALLPSP